MHKLKTPWSSNMGTTRVSREFRERYLEPEKIAVKKWMGRNMGESVLDVGAGDGRFTKLALDLGAKRIVALDIDDEMISKLRSISSSPNLEVVKANIREYQLADREFDTIMVLGNTVSGFYDAFENGEKSAQAETLRKLIRASKRHLFFTLQRPESYDLIRRFYEVNHWDLYGLDAETGVKRMRWQMKDGSLIEVRSQHFRREQVEKLLSEAGIPQTAYTISPINDINWQIEVRTGLVV